VYCRLHGRLRNNSPTVEGQLLLNPMTIYFLKRLFVTLMRFVLWVHSRPAIHYVEMVLYVDGRGARHYALNVSGYIRVYLTKLTLAYYYIKCTWFVALMQRVERRNYRHMCSISYKTYVCICFAHMFCIYILCIYKTYVSIQKE